jgi:hypothetical protein
MRFANFIATLIVALCVGVVGIAEAKFRGGGFSSFRSSSISRSYSAPRTSVPSIKPSATKPVTPAAPKVTPPVTTKPVTKTPTYTPMPVPAAPAPSTSSSSSMSWFWAWFFAEQIEDAIEGDDD